MKEMVSDLSEKWCSTGNVWYQKSLYTLENRSSPVFHMMPICDRNSIVRDFVILKISTANQGREKKETTVATGKAPWGSDYYRVEPSTDRPCNKTSTRWVLIWSDLNLIFQTSPTTKLICSHVSHAAMADALYPVAIYQSFCPTAEPGSCVAICVTCLELLIRRKGTIQAPTLSRTRLHNTAHICCCWRLPIAASVRGCRCTASLRSRQQPLPVRSADDDDNAARFMLMPSVCLFNISSAAGRPSSLKSLQCQ